MSHSLYVAYSSGITDIGCPFQAMIFKAPPFDPFL
uniref:Uncharacterized protein n=1 Tax=Anguilla anguilla TaxID=7936 RepID=A0A0E9VV14_ANGAN